MDLCWQSNMLCMLVITFLPMSKHLLISWLQSPSAVILEPRKIKSATVSTVSPSVSHEMMGPDAMIFIFWMLSFKPTFSLSSFTFIKRFCSSSSLSAVRVVSSAYLRLLIFLPAILIPACASSPVWNVGGQRKHEKVTNNWSVGFTAQWMALCSSAFFHLHRTKRLVLTNWPWVQVNVSFMGWVTENQSISYVLGSSGENPKLMHNCDMEELVYPGWSSHFA